MKNVGELSNQELLAGVQASFGEERRWVARVVAYLAEIERRRIHLEAAYSSLFDFCRRRLGMSDGEAFRRSTAARLVQRFPSILDALDRGDVHLSALVLLRDHFTDDNHGELVREASGKTKLEVQEMIATRFPKPDVPSRIAELPPKMPPQAKLALAGEAAPAPSTTTADEPRARVEPLSSARYRVELTASKELRDKLERARDLMRHRNPAGDLAAIVDKALDLLLAKLEKERLGKTTRPAKPKDKEKAECTKEPDATRPGYVPRSVRRAVYERDGEQCTFVDDEGRRCPARAFLELDHAVSRGIGGNDELDNLRVRCRAHNKVHAEHVFGRDYVERQIRLRQQKCGRDHVKRQTRLRQQECGAADASAFETAARGLRNLGFREPEVRRALAAVRAKLDPAAASTEAVLREALALAT